MPDNGTLKLTVDDGTVLTPVRYARARRSSLSDSHLLGHLSLAGGTTGTGTCGGAGLLLEDLPELQALISG